MSAEVVQMTTTQDASQQQTTDETGGDARGGGRPVVVAYDGSSASAAALTWAAREAGARSARLRVLFAADVGGADSGGAAVLAQAAHEAGVQLAEEGASWATQVEGGPVEVAVETDVRLGSPTFALVQASQDADLLVVGNRGRGAVAGALLGSVAFSVTAQAACPVVVVRGDTERRPGAEHPVVVGVDGSDAALASVAYAADAAVTAGAPLVVLAAWTPPEILAAGYGAAHLPEMVRKAEEAARGAAESALAWARERHADLVGEARPVREKPAKALIAASGTAGLVVVGARGYGSIGGLFLGSVSHATIHRAQCPVAVVRSLPQA